MVASAQSTSSPFIQIFEVSCIVLSPGSLPEREWYRSVLHQFCGFRMCEALEVAGRQPDDMPLGAGTGPHDLVQHQLTIDEDAGDARGRERSHAARFKPRRREYLRDARDTCVSGTRRGGHLVEVGTTIARHEREHR